MKALKVHQGGAGQRGELLQGRHDQPLGAAFFTLPVASMVSSANGGSCIV